ncbi:MAG TPA: response regulator [Verrucomicrobiae bacterium]|nr:response regulator [Verrucomicrobiae bacterium]
MKQKILAIDDSLTLREFIQRCLAKQSAEYQIVLAKDGTEGLTLAARELPDLILLDFVLPDMKGDEVCRRLQGDTRTAGLPVVLMSSSAADIKRTQEQFENVIKAIAKPFTPELLCATVAHSLREVASAPRSAAAAGGKTRSGHTAMLTKAMAAAPISAVKADFGLAGDTSQFSLISVLLALEQDQLTGCLRVNFGAKPLELYVVSGRPVLVTLRDAAAYLRGSNFKLTAEQTAIAAKTGRHQAETGSPIFMQFAEQGLMSAMDAFNLCQQQGLRLFAHLWTAPRAHFKFEANATLPPLTAGLSPFNGTMSEWAMETLRYVGNDFRSAMAWGEPTGIPAYTRKGYERIQQIPLSDEELAFAGLISPTNSLAKIAEGMRVDVDTAQRILHRFLCLEIFDYWPASLLQAA